MIVVWPNTMVLRMVFGKGLVDTRYLQLTPGLATLVLVAFTWGRLGGFSNMAAGAVLSFLSCGQHTFIDLVDATATRGADDHVTVKTSFGWEVTGQPKKVSQYCVTGARGCHAVDETNALPDIVLISELPVPRLPPTLIVLEGSGNNLIGSTDGGNPWLVSPWARSRHPASGGVIHDHQQTACVHRSVAVTSVSRDVASCGLGPNSSFRS